MNLVFHRMRLRRQLEDPIGDQDDGNAAGRPQIGKTSCLPDTQILSDQIEIIHCACRQPASSVGLSASYGFHHRIRTEC